MRPTDIDSSRRDRFAAGGAAVVLFALAACARDQEPPPAQRPNVLLLTLDTTRADRLGCYGHARAITPNLDALARAGARFTHAWSNVPVTLPAHASILTGVFPPEHGLHDNGRGALPADVPTLPEIFRARGWRTGAFVSSAVLDAAFGLARGFDEYDDRLGPRDANGQVPAERGGAATVDAASAWLAREPAQPFFAWVHLYDPHAPYEAPSPWKERCPDPYDAEIASMDAQVGRLLAALDKVGALAHTIVVVVADHGEALGEHGEESHGVLVHDATMRVPLIVRAPGHAPRVVADRAQLVDLAPTVSALAGIESAFATSGRSLVPAIDGVQLAEVPIYGESEYARINFGWSPLHALVSGRWKYVHGSRPHLFDLATDAHEDHDASAAETTASSSLAAQLEGVRKRMHTRSAAKNASDPELVKKLETLGYAQSGSSATADVPLEGLRDPAAMMDVVRDFNAAGGYLDRGLFDKAIPLFERAAQACPDGAAFHWKLGQAYAAARRTAEAKSALARALALDPRHARAQTDLGRVLADAGELEPALARFDVARALEPGDFSIDVARAWVLVRLERNAEAVDALKSVVAARPAEASFRMSLVRLLRSNGRHVEALAALRELAQLRPDDAGIALFYAWELATNPDARARDGKRAVELAETVVQRRGRARGDDLDTLAAAYAESGRFDEALKTIEEALATPAGANDAPLRAEWAARRDLYLDKQPFRDG